MVTAFVSIDKTLAALGQRDDVRAQASDAAVLTVAVVAAKSCQSHQARALPMLPLGRSRSGARSVARFNRRLHARRDWRGLARETLGARFASGAVFLLDRMPVPVCRRARARRCRTVSGTACCGYCAATGAKFCGWRRHRIGTTAGVPVAFALLPGGRHDLPPIHELTDGLPAEATVDGAKGDNAAADAGPILAATGVRLVPIRTANLAPTRWADTRALRAYRKRIEARYRQLEAMGVQRLRARTTPGLALKRHAALLAVSIANAD